MPEAPPINDSETELSVLILWVQAFVAQVLMEPTSYNLAKRSQDWLEWSKAIDNELASLKKNNAWDAVPRPTDRKFVDSKWVFKLKTNANGNIRWYKAWLVARGFTQQPGLDYKWDFFTSCLIWFDVPTPCYCRLHKIVTTATWHQNVSPL